MLVTAERKAAPLMTQSSHGTDGAHGHRARGVSRAGRSRRSPRPVDIARTTRSWSSTSTAAVGDDVEAVADVAGLEHRRRRHRTVVRSQVAAELLEDRHRQGTQHRHPAEQVDVVGPDGDGPVDRGEPRPGEQAHDRGHGTDGEQGSPGAEERRSAAAPRSEPRPTARAPALSRTPKTRASTASGTIRAIRVNAVTSTRALPTPITPAASSATR